MSIHKDDLIGKYVYFRDRNGAFRINKVRRVIGTTLSTVDVLRRCERVRQDHVFCWIHHGHVKEEIDWERRKREAA